MQKLFNNFVRILDVLRNADLTEANNNIAYKKDVIVQFIIAFTLAWKTLQEVLQLQGVLCTPKEVLQNGLKFGIINDSAVWFNMLEKRNASLYISDENEINEIISLIRDSYIPAFIALENILREKIEEAESEEA